MGRIDIKQGSPKWKALRQTKITATMASSIMAMNPYKSVYQLFEELTGLKEETPPNEAMLRGTALEPLALDAFNTETGFLFCPAVWQSDEHPWAMASLDGAVVIGSEVRAIVEIKCGKTAFKQALKGEIAPYYHCQMMHQMMVCNVPEMEYYAYWEGNGVRIKIDRDQEFIDKMVIAEEKFYNDWQNLIPPVIESAIWDVPYESYIEQCDQIGLAIKEELTKDKKC